VYVPLPTSVVAPNVPVEVPPELLITIVEPPVVRLLPAASLACNVHMITAPPFILLVADTVTTETVLSIAPTVTLQVGNVEVTVTSLIVQPNV
jgi:hypothetical protein